MLPLTAGNCGGPFQCPGLVQERHTSGQRRTFGQVGYILLVLLPFSLLLALAYTLYILFLSPESDASEFDSDSFTTLPQVRDFCHEDKIFDSVQ